MMCVAFRALQKQILIEPIFAQFIQAASRKMWFPGWLEAINEYKFIIL